MLSLSGAKAAHGGNVKVDVPTTGRESPLHSWQETYTSLFVKARAVVVRRRPFSLGANTKKPPAAILQAASDWGEPGRFYLCFWGCLNGSRKRKGFIKFICRDNF